MDSCCPFHRNFPSGGHSIATAAQCQAEEEHPRQEERGSLSFPSKACKKTSYKRQEDDGIQTAEITLQIVTALESRKTRLETRKKEGRSHLSATQSPSHEVVRRGQTQKGLLVRPARVPGFPGKDRARSQIRTRVTRHEVADSNKGASAAPLLRFKLLAFRRGVALTEWPLEVVALRIWLETESRGVRRAGEQSRASSPEQHRLFVRRRQKEES